MRPRVGQPVQYLQFAAIVTHVWNDDCVDLVYWDRYQKQWVEQQSVYRGQWSSVTD